VDWPGSCAPSGSSPPPAAVACPPCPPLTPTLEHLVLERKSIIFFPPPCRLLGHAHLPGGNERQRHEWSAGAAPQLWAQRLLPARHERQPRAPPEDQQQRLAVAGSRQGRGGLAGACVVCCRRLLGLRPASICLPALGATHSPTHPTSVPVCRPTHCLSPCRSRRAWMAA
jgi:hypothetical protein